MRPARLRALVANTRPLGAGVGLDMSVFDVAKTTVSKVAMVVAKGKKRVAQVSVAVSWR